MVRATRLNSDQIRRAHYAKFLWTLDMGFELIAQQKDINKAALESAMEGFSRSRKNESAWKNFLGIFAKGM